MKLAKAVSATETKDALDMDLNNTNHRRMTRMKLLQRQRGNYHSHGDIRSNNKNKKNPLYHGRKSTSSSSLKTRHEHHDDQHDHQDSSSSYHHCDDETDFTESSHCTASPQRRTSYLRASWGGFLGMKPLVYDWNGGDNHNTENQDTSSSYPVESPSLGREEVTSGDESVRILKERQDEGRNLIRGICKCLKELREETLMAVQASWLVHRDRAIARFVANNRTGAQLSLNKIRQLEAEKCRIQEAIEYLELLQAKWTSLLMEDTIKNHSAKSMPIHESSKNHLSKSARKNGSVANTARSVDNAFVTNAQHEALDLSSLRVYAERVQDMLTPPPPKVKQVCTKDEENDQKLLIDNEIEALVRQQQNEGLIDDDGVMLELVEM